MINVAAGLAIAGKIVFCYSIASFATLRCLEQIKVNICSMNLPVTIIGAGAGFSFGYDGPTHHGHQDVSSMRLMPEMSIIELSSNDVVEKAVDYVVEKNGPCYIRLDKGLFLSNVHYLNWSDNPGGRITGLTRYACFWVEGGEIVAPIETMRFDDSFYRFFGSELESVGSKVEVIPDVLTYGQRNLGVVSCPGVLTEKFQLTL